MITFTYDEKLNLLKRWGFLIEEVPNEFFYNTKHHGTNTFNSGKVIVAILPLQIIPFDSDYYDYSPSNVFYAELKKRIIQIL